QKASRFFGAARRGRLPAVSWVVPNGRDSEHPGRSIADGQAWVTSLVNAVMRGPDWNSTAIFVSWDDWGGFYDHVVPPDVDRAGYGIRVPGFVISPGVKAGTADHQTVTLGARGCSRAARRAAANRGGGIVRRTHRAWRVRPR